VPFFLLALYLIAFSLGISLLVLALLTYEKNRNKALRDSAVILVAATLLLVVDALKTYVKVVNSVFDTPLILSSLVFAMIGNGLLAYALPLLAFRLVDLPVSGKRWIFHAVFIGALMGVGFLEQRPGGALFDILDAIAIGAIHVYAAVVVLFNFNRISDLVLRSLLRGFLFLIAGLILLIIVQLALLNRLSLPSIWGEVPYVQLLYQIGVICLTLYFAARYMYNPAPIDICDLPADFVTRYGISKRECEIVSLVIEGRSYKEIAEKLFISSRTVKNHIYNIYQKTKVENKVQLLNLIRSKSS
jgi:DNA-binding CsgD family transcriptional regulator/predicted membrane protein